MWRPTLSLLGPAICLLDLTTSSIGMGGHRRNTWARYIPRPQLARDAVREVPAAHAETGRGSARDTEATPTITGHKANTHHMALHISRPERGRRRAASGRGRERKGASRRILSDTAQAFRSHCPSRRSEDRPSRSTTAADASDVLPHAPPPPLRPSRSNAASKAITVAVQLGAQVQHGLLDHERPVDEVAGAEAEVELRCDARGVA